MLMAYLRSTYTAAQVLQWYNGLLGYGACDTYFLVGVLLLYLQSCHYGAELVITFNIRLNSLKFFHTGTLLTHGECLISNLLKFMTLVSC